MFVPADVGKMFELDSLQPKVDDKLVASHLYSPLRCRPYTGAACSAFYLGNLKAGTRRGGGLHRARDRTFATHSRAATPVRKGATRPTSSWRIVDSRPSCSPEFDVKVQ